MLTPPHHNNTGQREREMKTGIIMFINAPSQERRCQLLLTYRDAASGGSSIREGNRVGINHVGVRNHATTSWSFWFGSIRCGGRLWVQCRSFLDKDARFDPFFPHTNWVRVRITKRCAIFVCLCSRHKWLVEGRNRQRDVLVLVVNPYSSSSSSTILWLVGREQSMSKTTLIDTNMTVYRGWQSCTFVGRFQECSRVTWQSCCCGHGCFSCCFE